MDGEEATAEHAARRRRRLQWVSVCVGSMGATVAAGAFTVGAATMTFAAGAAVLPVVALVYGVAKLSATDYDSPSEMRRLREAFVASPGSVGRRHRPADVFRTHPAALCAALSEAASRALSDPTAPRGVLHIAADCRHARGGGLEGMGTFCPEVYPRLAEMIVAHLDDRPPREETVPGSDDVSEDRTAGGGRAGSFPGRVAREPGTTPLWVMRDAMTQRGWRHVMAAGGGSLETALTAEAVTAVRFAASLEELARCCGDAPVNDGGEVLAAATGRVAAEAMASDSATALSRAAGGKANLGALLTHDLLDPDDIAALLAREAAGSSMGGGLEKTLTEVGARILDAAMTARGVGRAHTARVALASLLSADLSRAASPGSAGADAYEALLRGRGLGYAVRHRGFGDGMSNDNDSISGHEALAGVLDALQRSKARLELAERRHQRAAKAAAERTAGLRAQLERVEQEAITTAMLGTEEDGGILARAERAWEMVRATRGALADAEAAEARAAQEAEAERSPLIAEMRTQFQREWTISPDDSSSERHFRGGGTAGAAEDTAETASRSSSATEATAAATASPPHAFSTSPAVEEKDTGAPDVSPTCKVCLERPLEMLLMPCRHVSLCRQCAADPRLMRCPVCRASIQRKERVFV